MDESLIEGSWNTLTYREKAETAQKSRSNARELVAKFASGIKKHGSAMKNVAKRGSTYAVGAVRRGSVTASQGLGHAARRMSIATAAQTGVTARREGARASNMEPLQQTTIDQRTSTHAKQRAHTAAAGATKHARSFPWSQKPRSLKGKAVAQKSREVRL